MSGNLVQDGRRGTLGARVLLGGPPQVRGVPQPPPGARGAQPPPGARGAQPPGARGAQPPPALRGAQPAVRGVPQPAPGAHGAQPPAGRGVPQPAPGGRGVPQPVVGAPAGTAGVRAAAFRGPAARAPPVATAPVFLSPVFSERQALTQETAVSNFTRERQEGRKGEAAIIPKRYLTAVHALNNLLQETKFVWVQGSSVVELGEQINLEGVYPNAVSRRITVPNMIQIVENLGFSGQRFEWTEAPLLAATMNHHPDTIGAIIEIKQGEEYHWMSITKNNTALHRPVCGPGYKWAYFNSLTRKRISCDDNLSNIYTIFNDPTKEMSINTVIIVRNNRRPGSQFRVISGPSNNSNVEDYDEDEQQDNASILAALEAAASLEAQVLTFTQEVEAVAADYFSAQEEIAGDEAAIQGASAAINSALPARRIALQQDIQRYRAALEAAKQKKQAALEAAARLRRYPHLRSMVGTRAHTLLSQGLQGGRRKTRRRAPVRQTRRIKRVHH